MKIVVLAGGLSPERDVSFSSGALIANALMENGHEVMLLDLYLGEASKEFPAVFHKKDSGGFQFSYQVPEKEPDLAALKASSGMGEAMIGRGVLELCQKADQVFLGLHGSVGENGQLQALFDLYGISYTGTGYAGSLLAMNKDVSKKLMRAAGILTPDWRFLDLTREDAFQHVKLPCVVKPCGCGSSIGVTIAESGEEFRKAIAYARKYEDTVLIEEKIAGREFSVGILNHEALPAIEIRPKAGFYDYANKYQKGASEEICPADLPEETERRLRESAKAVHKILQLGFYSRVDFILDEKGELYCLEANTLPGMTPTSLLPQEALAVGISYRELCDRIAKG